MARLTAGQWAQAKADYEVRGISLGEVARRHGVSQQAVSLRAKKESWQRGKTCGLVNKKVNAIKELAEVESKTCDLPQVFQLTIEQAVQERLAAEGLLAALSNRIASKAIALTAEADTPEALEMLSRVKRNLAPQQAASTTVNVTQQQAQQVKTPEQVCDELIAQQHAEIEAAGNGADAR